MSFARTPLAEISGKEKEIAALGWREDRRGDPWVVSYIKQFPSGEQLDPEEELRRVMGPYWLTPEDIRSLLDSSQQTPT